MISAPAPDVPEPAEALAAYLVDGVPARNVALAAVHALRTLSRHCPFTANQAAREVLAIWHDGAVPEAMATHREALGMDSPAAPPGSPAGGPEGPGTDTETSGTLSGAQEAVSVPDGGDHD